MTEQLQARLKEIARECGGNRALCEKSGVSERTFANWLAGSSEPKIIGLYSVARAAGVTIDWIVTGEKPKRRLDARNSVDGPTIQLPTIDKTLTTGNEPVDQRFQIINHTPFSKDYLINRLNQDNFDALCLIQVGGNSMEPTMGDGDFVLVNRTMKETHDGLFAFVFKDSIHIKRLVNVLNGIDVVSDNKDLYPPYRIEGDDLRDFQIIGRVIWIAKTVL